MRLPQRCRTISGMRLSSLTHRYTQPHTLWQLSPRSGEPVCWDFSLHFSLAARSQSTETPTYMWPHQIQAKHHIYGYCKKDESNRLQLLKKLTYKLRCFREQYSPGSSFMKPSADSPKGGGEVKCFVHIHELTVLSKQSTLRHLSEAGGKASWFTREWNTANEHSRVPKWSL